MNTIFKRICMIIIATLLIVCILPLNRVNALDFNEGLQLTIQSKDFDPFSSRYEGMRLQAFNSFPTKFDLRSWVDEKGIVHNIVSDVKQQGSWGTCWGFATVAASETSILSEMINKGIVIDRNDPKVDLSERHLAWFAYAPTPLKYAELFNQVNEKGETEGSHIVGGVDSSIMDFGSNMLYASNLLSKGVGVLLEEHDEEPGGTLYKNDENYVVLEEITQDKEGYNIITRKMKPLAEMSTEDLKKARYFAAMYIDASGNRKTTTWNVKDELWNQSEYELEESSLLPSLTIYSNGEYAGYSIEGMNAVKSELMAGRAVSIGFHASAEPAKLGRNTLYIKENADGTWSHWTSEDESANHAVTIVGWDDSYSKENFRQFCIDVPEGDGAWIVKNSWGSEIPETNNYIKRYGFNPNYGDWGTRIGEDGKPNINGKNSGYFYLSYYDPTLSMAETFDYDLSQDYIGEFYELDQYDLLTTSYFSTMSASNEFSIANVFTSRNDQRVRTLTSFTTAPETEVTYKLYRLNDEFTNPTDGELITTINKKYQYGGYHRINIAEDEQLRLREGDKFSVVQTQKVQENASDYLYLVTIPLAEGKYSDEEIAEYRREVIEHLWGMYIKLSIGEKVEEFIKNNPEATKEELDDRIAEITNEVNAIFANLRNDSNSEISKEINKRADEEIQNSFGLYNVGVVNSKESWIQPYTNDSTWVDYAFFMEEQHKDELDQEHLVYDNVPIKSFGEIEDYASVESLKQLKQLIVEANELLNNTSVSIDGSDIGINDKWVSQVEYDDFSDVIDLSQTLLDKAGDNFDLVISTTPIQKDVDDEINKLQTEIDAFTALLKDSTDENICTISFNPNGGTGIMDSVEVVKNTEYTLPTCLYLPSTGYKFRGWSYTADGEILNDYIEITSSITLYARWIKDDLPIIIEKPNEDISRGQNAIFVSDADFIDFIEVKVDNNTIQRDIDYTVESGSTKVTLTSSFIDKLSIGTHTLDIVSKNGSASTTFTIKSNNPISDTVNTGEGNQILIWLSLTAMSLFGMIVMLMIYKYKRI